MEYLAPIASALLVVVLILALEVEKRRRKRERRMRLLFSYSSPTNYEDPLSRAVSALIERFRDIERLLGERSSYIRNLNDRLFYADVRLSALPYLLISAGISLIVLAILVWQGVMLLIAQALVIVSFLVLSRMYLRWQISRKRRLFEQQLPEFLLLVSSALKSGLSLMQAIDSVARRGSGEIERQFRRATREIGMGMAPKAAFDTLAIRSQSEDMRWVVVAMDIQREVGGNLANILQSVGETMRQRSEIEQEVRVLSAEGRLSAVLLLVLPIGVFAGLWVLNREYIAILWSSPIGIGLIGVFGALVVIGALWMRKIVQVKV